MSARPAMVAAELTACIAKEKAVAGVDRAGRELAGTAVDRAGRELAGTAVDRANS